MQFAKIKAMLNEVSKFLTKASNIVFAPFVLCLCIMTSGCPDRQPAPDDSGRAEMRGYFDWSISTEDGQMKDFAQSFADHLPEIIEQQAITNFTAFQFGADGWNPKKIASIDFPSLPQKEVGEAGMLMPKVAEAEKEKMRKQYREQIQNRLFSINAASFVPPADMTEPNCTDLNGLFRRIVAARGRHRQIAIVVTDGHENCSKLLHSVDAPSDGLALVIVLLPEKYKGNMSSPKYDEFERRSAELKKALPWAIVIAPFEDFSSAVGEALAKASNPASSKQLSAMQISN